MTKGLKKNISSFFILLLLISLLPLNSVEATTGTSIIEENNFLYNAVEDIAIRNQSETEEKIVKINQGTNFYVSEITEDEALLQIGENSFSISLDSIIKVDQPVNDFKISAISCSDFN